MEGKEVGRCPGVVIFGCEAKSSRKHEVGTKGHEGRPDMDFFEHRASLGERADEETERLAAAVIGAAIEVHKHLRAGLNENVYQRALCHELSLRNIPFSSQAEVPVVYKGMSVGQGFIDILVRGKLVVELKSVGQFTDAHRSQVIAYLSATGLRLGLLINRNVLLLKQGLKRIVYDPMTPPS
jgi:GxxExxY protein